MASFNERIYEIIEDVRNNYIVDDTELTEVLVARKIHDQRALWIRNEYNKPGRILDDNIVQDLGCIPLIEVDRSECCHVSTNCFILRTESKIPATIEFYRSTGITRIGLPDKLTISINFVSYDQAIFSGNGKYNKNMLFAFLLNNYIYIISKSNFANMIDWINIRGVFEDPEEASRFVDCDNKPCFSYNEKYPVNNWMWPYIKGEVVKQLVSQLQIPKDKANDTQDKLDSR